MEERKLFKAYGVSLVGNTAEEYQKQIETDYAELSTKEYEAAKAYAADAWLFNEI